MDPHSLFVVTVRSGKCLGNSRLGEDIIEPVEIWLVGVRCSLRIRVVRRRPAGAKSKVRISDIKSASRHLPIVDIGCRVGDGLGVLDIEVGLYSWVGLVVSTTTDLLGSEVPSNSISTELFKECL